MCLAATDAGLAPEQFDFGRDIPATLPLPIESLARLLANRRPDQTLPHPAGSAPRAGEQAARTRSDEDIRPLFAGDAVDAAWLDAAGDSAQVLCRMLGGRQTKGGGRAGWPLDAKRQRSAFSAEPVLGRPARVDSSFSPRLVRNICPTASTL